jgi:hypothetical protein
MSDAEQKVLDEAVAAMKAAADHAMACALHLQSVAMNPWGGDVVHQAERLQGSVRWFRSTEEKRLADLAELAKEGR